MYPLSEEQRKQLEKQERKAERQEERRKMMEKLEVDQQKSSKNFVVIMCFIICFTAFLLGIPLCGNSWGMKQFTGLGVSIFSIRTSLFALEIDIKCKTNFIESRICKIGQKFNGVHALHESQGMVCAVSDTMCQTLRSYYTASFYIFISFSLAIILNLFGSFCLYSYWFNTPLPRLRQWTAGLITGAPLTAATGLLVWTFTTPNLGTLPNTWTFTTVMFTGTDLFSFKETYPLSFGWCWIFSWIAIFFMFMQCLVWFCLFSSNPMEEEAQFQADNLKEHIEQLQADASMALAASQLSPYQQDPRLGFDQAAAYQTAAMGQSDGAWATAPGYQPPSFAGGVPMPVKG
jgi:hypothetical protein